MSLIRRLPKFGFTNIHRKETKVINLKDLNIFDAGAVVDLDALKKAKLIAGSYKGSYKILGNGDLQKKLTIKAHAFSKKAEDAITKAGGQAEVIQ